MDRLRDEYEYGKKWVEAAEVGFMAISAESAEAIGRELGANYGAQGTT